MQSMREELGGIGESNGEADKKIEKLAVLVSNVCKEVGGIGESNGMVAHEFIFNALSKDLTFAGIQFYDIAKLNKYRKASGLKGQYDIVMTNTDTLTLGEAKQRVRLEDINKLINKQLPDFRILFPEYNHYKVILALGGLCFDDNVEEEAKKNGIGIIKIVGDKLEYQTENIKIY
jgi:hypothetical protein